MADCQTEPISRRGFLTSSVASLTAAVPSDGPFAPRGTGAVMQSLQNEPRKIVSVKDFGVAADGRTDDTAALQSAINATAVRGDLDLGRGTILISAPIDATALAYTKLFGSATIKAADDTDFMYLLDISGTTGVTIEGLVFDANKNGRGAAAVGRLGCLLANKTILNVLDGLTFKNALGAAGPVSSVAVSASDGVLGLHARGLRFLDLGIDANTKPSDGLFVRGDHCSIHDTYGEGVTDHIVVLEGCNYSTVKNTMGMNSTSFVAVSNDTNTDVVGNVIDGVTGTCNYFGSFGAVVGVYTFGSGRIIECRVANVAVSGTAGAGGGGPALFFSGKVEGEVTHLVVHPGASAGVMHHVILIDIDGHRGVLRIADSDLTADPAGTCIRLLGRSRNVEIVGNRLRGGSHGVFGDGTSSFREANNAFSGQTVSKVGGGGSA